MGDNEFMFCDGRPDCDEQMFRHGTGGSEQQILDVRVLSQHRLEVKSSDVL